ncbi:MAG: hypothetical protein ABIP89_11685 [Polyangiaceae bacterium]
MSEYLLDIDVVLEEEDDRPTLEIPEEKLRVLVAKSTPPSRLISIGDRTSSAPPFVLSTPWSAHH